ncbi:MAG: DDE-type integrase/transposase/recombinase [Alphaproteobacteria bacterium]
MGERGFEINHVTLNRWVLHCVPPWGQMSRQYKRSVHRSWRMDETYMKIKGKWRYFYRLATVYVFLNWGFKLT